VSGELRLEDRVVINLVEDGIDLAGPHRPSRRFLAWSRGMSAEMRRGSWWRPPALPERHGEPKTPEAIASHQTIQFGASAVTGEWRFVADGGDFRVNVTPRLATNSATPAIQYAEQGGGLTRVLAYQAADAIKRGRLKIVLASFEQPALPIHTSIRHAPRRT